MAKKSSAKQVRLDARAAQIRAQVEAERRRTFIVVAVFVVVAVVGAGILYFLTNPPGPSPSTAGAKALGAVQTIPDEGRGHVPRPTRVTYKHQPPSSGDHYSDQLAPRPWGTVKTPVLAEEYVHNLEHGGIVLLYQCSGGDCDTNYQLAQQIFSQLPKDSKFNEVKLLAAPYQDMPAKATLLAWDHQRDFAGMPGLDDVKAFYLEFVNKGPESVP
jgi:hypothetical protein